ncbi:MAG: cupin domain-containing protein [Candidatus Dormibacteraeota bacterium]|nr:cupin domain-containing protein [Candidatus Dormibacteraeota bacterium]
MTHRQLFHTNVAELDNARVQREDGWVDLNIKFLSETISGFGEVCLFRASFPPNAEHQRHIHANAVEFFYVISGRGSSGCGNEEHDVSAGSLELIQKGAVHWLRNVSEDTPIEVIGGYLAVGSLDEAGYEPVHEH